MSTPKTDKQKKKWEILLFVCRKCEHHLFTEEKEGWVKKMAKLECPNCGEEPPIWIYTGHGKWAEHMAKVLGVNL